VNAFNRAVTIVVLLLLMIVVPMVTLLPDVAIGVLQRSLVAVPASLSTFHRVVLILLGIICFIIGGLILYLEVRRPPRKRVRIQKVSGGEAQLAVESIEQRLEYRVDQLADVIKVMPKVKPHRASVDVVLNVETVPDVDVPMKTDEVCQIARDVVEERMGLKLGKIKVNISHAPYPEGA
jgi:hypothetical protein